MVVLCAMSVGLVLFMRLLRCRKCSVDKKRRRLEGNPPRYFKFHWIISNGNTLYRLKSSAPWDEIQSLTAKWPHISAKSSPPLDLVQRTGSKSTPKSPFRWISSNEDQLTYERPAHARGPFQNLPHQPQTQQKEPTIKVESTLTAGSAS